MKIISDLTVGETIAELEKLPEELRQTPYTREGLIIHLAVQHLATDIFDNSKNEEHKLAEEFLEFLLQNGNEEDRRLVEIIFRPK